jgi:hypothetical protein
MTPFAESNFLQFSAEGNGGHADTRKWAQQNVSGDKPSSRRPPSDSGQNRKRRQPSKKSKAKS